METCNMIFYLFQTNNNFANFPLMDFTNKYVFLKPPDNLFIVCNNNTKVERVHVMHNIQIIIVRAERFISGFPEYM